MGNDERDEMKYETRDGVRMGGMGKVGVGGRDRLGCETCIGVGWELEDGMEAMGWNGMCSDGRDRLGCEA